MSQPVSVGEDNDNNNNAEGDGKRLEQQRSGNKREKELEDEEEEVEDEEVHTDAENTPTPPPPAAMAIVRKVKAKEEAAAALKMNTVGVGNSNRGSGKKEGREGINHQAPDNGQQQKQEQKTGGSAAAESRAGGSAASASSVAPTDDVESQATTTNVDESGDSDVGGAGAAAVGGHNEPGKMFVGGLSWQTSAEGLRDYFCKFGEVNECMVMRDPTTKRARGFGFITFCDPMAVEKVLAMESHELDGKRIDPKIAFPKKQQPKMVIKTKKVFIGGLSASSTLEDIKNYFSQYGHIEDAMLMFDKSTQRHRGFGFITFDDDEVSDKVCEIHFHEINGKMVECKKAQPKEVMLPLQLNKTRAAAARNLYGLAPEQLLAYASYIPRLPANAYGPGMSTAAVQHHGMLTTAAGYPTCSVNAAIPGSAVPTAAFSGNGFPGGHPHHTHRHHHQPVAGPPSQFAAIAAGGHSVAAIRSGVSNNGGLNPRDLATAQLVAQQQAVYEAAMVYANQLSTLAASASMDFSAAVHHQHHQQQQHPMAAPQHQQQPGPLQFPASVVSGQPMALALHSAGPPHSAQAALPPPPPQSAHFGKQQ